MHTTYLRKVGGAVMLAVPATLLDVLNLGVGAKVTIGIEDGRIVVAPGTRPSYSLEELLAQCDDTAPDNDGDRAWFNAAPVGRELPL
ncbi:MAG: antitoxin [bacterium]|nr:antitoxin [bacterium]